MKVQLVIKHEDTSLPLGKLPLPLVSQKPLPQAPGSSLESAEGPSRAGQRLSWQLLSTREALAEVSPETVSSQHSPRRAWPPRGPHATPYPLGLAAPSQHLEAFLP